MMLGPRQLKSKITGPYKRNQVAWDAWYYNMGKTLNIHVQADGLEGLMHYEFNIRIPKKP